MSRSKPRPVSRGGRRAIALGKREPPGSRRTGPVAWASVSGKRSHHRSKKTGTHRIIETLLLAHLFHCDGAPWAGRRTRCRWKGRRVCSCAWWPCRPWWWPEMLRAMRWMERPRCVPDAGASTPENDDSLFTCTESLIGPPRSTLRWVVASGHWWCRISDVVPGTHARLIRALKNRAL